MERTVTSEGEGELNKASKVSQMLASKVGNYLRQAQGMSRYVDNLGLDKSQSLTVPCHRILNREIETNRKKPEVMNTFSHAKTNPG